MDDEGDEYQSAGDYIRGEYGDELPIIRAILDRFKPRFLGMTSVEERDETLDKLAMQIVGYYTGCLTPSGLPRVGRRRSMRDR